MHECAACIVHFHGENAIRYSDNFAGSISEPDCCGLPATITVSVLGAHFGLVRKRRAGLPLQIDITDSPLPIPIADKRYQAVNPLPASLSDSSNVADNTGIKGEALPGRAAYLDLQATTPLDPRVLDAMMPYYTHAFGNPHSRTHSYGWEAEQVVEKSRQQVADLIGADPKEIVFTSGATESNNLAIKGVARFYRGKKNHVITTAIEHKCVLDSCRWLEQEGWQVTYLPVQQNGLVDLAALEAAMRPETVLVSVMGVNNEIGVIQVRVG